MKKKLYLMASGFYWLTGCEKQVNEDSFYSLDFIQALMQKYEVIYTPKNPDFLIYTPFSKDFFLYDCVRILWSGELFSPDLNLCDYSLGFNLLNIDDRYIHINSCSSHSFTEINYDIFTKHLPQNWNLENRNKFCSFMITNAAGNDFTPRIDFFKKLCEYKKVDSGGRALNNIGGPIGDRFGSFEKSASSKKEWLKNYKFNICFENASYPGYLTEKLWDAFSAGCIPIYWGDTSLRCDLDLESKKYIESKYIESKQEDSIKIKINNKIPNIKKELLPPFRLNPKAFINAHNYSNWNDVIEEIKRIDNNQKAYEEMLSEPVFLNNFSAQDLRKYDYDRIMDFLYNIFDQDPQDARKRTEAQTVQYEVINKYKLGSLFDYVNIHYDYFVNRYIKHPKTAIFKIIFKFIKYNSKLREFCLEHKLKK